VNVAVDAKIVGEGESVSVNTGVGFGPPATQLVRASAMINRERMLAVDLIITRFPERAFVP
jgi:hypothetical protein